MEILIIKNLKYARNFQLSTIFLLNKKVKQKSGSSHSNMFLKVGVPREKLKSREKPSKNFLVHLQAEGLQLFKK